MSTSVGGAPEAVAAALPRRRGAAAPRTCRLLPPRARPGVAGAVLHHPVRRDDRQQPVRPQRLLAEGYQMTGTGRTTSTLAGVRGGLPAVLPVRGARDRRLHPARVPPRLRDRVQGGPVAQPDAGRGHRARSSPASWCARCPGSSCSATTAPSSASCTPCRASSRRPAAARDAGRRDHRADLQLPAVHGAAALRQPGEGRPPAHRGGQDLYASPFTAFRMVTLPLALPGLVAGTLLTFIPVGRRLHQRRAAGQPADPHDRQRHPGPLPGRAVFPLAAGPVGHPHVRSWSCW